MFSTPDVRTNIGRI